MMKKIISVLMALVITFSISIYSFSLTYNNYQLLNNYTSLYNYLNSKMQSHNDLIYFRTPVKLILNVNDIVKKISFESQAVATQVTLTQVKRDYKHKYYKLQVKYYLNNTQYKDALELVEFIAPHLKGENQIKTIKNIHTFVLDWVSYSKDRDMDYTEYGALFNQQASCQGYSLLMKRYLDYFKIENKLVGGISFGDRHMWNKVLINGEWLHIDSTFNDNIQDKNKYFLKSWDFFSYDHILEIN